MRANVTIGVFCVLTVLLLGLSAIPPAIGQESGWGIPVKIETLDTGHARNAQVAIDTKGNAIAVWEQSDGSRCSIWSNRYMAGTGWGTAVLIETDDAGDAYNPQVAFDSQGKALAVWEQSDGALSNIWSNRYVVGTGWGTPELIETNNSGGAFEPQIVIDSSGNATAVWEQHNGSYYNIWANRFVDSVGWGTAELIEFETRSAYNPSLAVDSLGNVIAVWHQFNGSRSDIRFNRYVRDIGWGTPELVETNDTGDASYPRVDTDPLGNAIAVWQQFDGVQGSIWANRFVAGSGWEAARLIENNNSGEAYEPKVAMDIWGNALVVWQQSDNFRDNIWANRFSMEPGQGWGTAVLIEHDDAGGAGLPQIAMDWDGNAIAVWEHYNGARYNILANRYESGPWGTTGPGWGTAELIEFDDQGSASKPQIAVQWNGTAMVVWEQSDGLRDNIWSNRYVPPDTTPPHADAGPDQNIVPGTTVTFDGSGSTDNVGIVNFTWTFDDGGTQTLYGASPVYRFDNEGTFIVALTVMDKAGNSDTDSVTIKVFIPTPTDGQETTLLVYLLVAIIITIVVVILFLVLLAKRKRKGSGDSSNAHEEEFGKKV